ncbi:ABC transporter permease subunit, partial [Microbacterium sp. HSID17254]|uniref:ABC transporter permease subunit n=1 Tax=Microbacterium sp. HSID17254 TaxID=2419509 RepID=UPI003140203D
MLGVVLAPLVHPIDRGMAVFGLAEYPLRTSSVRRRAEDAIFAVVVSIAIAYALDHMVVFIAGTTGFAEVGHALFLGLITFARVIALIAVSMLVWVPIGVWIGLNPRVSRLAQPVVQVLASFPANFLFPLITAVLGATGISLDGVGILLMALGAQWYILFNVIAGASATPNDLREAA